MAAITSAASGLWSATATWTGAVVPGQADTVTIDHQVTLDGQYPVGGIEPASTGCLINANGQARLIVGSNAISYIAKGITP